MKAFLSATILTISASFSAPALAGDAAELNILGFSADGLVFAFEEFGIQDGSGFPYANRYYIDTGSDKFVAGSPVRVRIDDEAANLELVRQQARERGDAIVTNATLAANRGFTAGARPATQISGDAHHMAVNPRPVFPPIDPALELRLEEFSVQGPDFCADFGPIKGFRLTRLGGQPGEQAVLLHEDTALPASRGCALGYSIGAVQTFFPQGGAPVYAVLISVRSSGFEGPDHRWIAVPGRF
jgi:predicted secreted protein